jgi:hypothetical protein
MSQFVYFVVVAGLAVAFDALFGSWIEEKALRLGLWINGIDGEYADRIVELHKTGKLPR